MYVCVNKERLLSQHMFKIRLGVVRKWHNKKINFFESFYPPLLVGDVANHPQCGLSDKSVSEAKRPQNFFLKIMADTERPQKFLWTFCLNHEWCKTSVWTVDVLICGWFATSPSLSWLLPLDVINSLTSCP
jgi:hypothetical protein